MKNIEYLVSEFRDAIEKAKKEGDFISDYRFVKFPTGCCGITSELLAKYLWDNEIRIKLYYVNGTYYNNTLDKPAHAWLKTEYGNIIDITGDQFKDYPLPFNFKERIYIGPQVDFYDFFELHEETILCNYDSLNDLSSRGYLSRQRLYEIILKHIN